MSYLELTYFKDTPFQGYRLVLSIINIKTIKSMKSNLEKWNHYESILKERAEVFLNSISPIIPEKFYLVQNNGHLEECFVDNRHYSFFMYFSGKKPKTSDVEKIKALAESDIVFNENLAYFDYHYFYEYNGKNGQASTALKIKDLVKGERVFLNKEDAEIKAKEVKDEKDADNLFRETHKKDANYNYGENGYKFLGWQNSWSHVYFDEDGKQTTGDIEKGEKPKRTAGYTKEAYPEYGTCRELKHKIIDVSHNNRGSEHTVSCPICKIYWKYDSSD